MPAHPPSSILHPRRVLVRGVNWLGDAVMTTPALQRLRQALPGTHIALLTREKLAPLWHQHPSLDAVLPFGAGEMPWAVARRLRAGSFDAALVLPNSPRAALEVWMARIPRRIGYARRWRNWLLTQAITARPGQHRMHKRSATEINRLIRLPAADRRIAAGNSYPSAAHHIHEYLDLAAALGADPEPLPPKLEITAAEIQQAEQALLSSLRRQSDAAAPRQRPTLLGINPGAHYGPAKRWPAESFAAVARAVSSRSGNCLWLALGGAADEKVCSDIARLAGGGVVNLAGKTSLRELMALLKLCRVLLTNDSGPMHVAAALGTPVVAIFGSTAPELTGPGLPGDVRHQVLKAAPPCSPCFRRTCPIDLRCLTGTTADRVIEAVFQALSRA
jgi:heptosyltransferase II